jgi:DNA-binding transcriptional LysR family regulator
MIDYRIETFLTVCRYMNFTKAAEVLNITQPAVSQHIKFLEESYDIKIFMYEGKRLRLTKQGEVLLNAATTVLHDDIFLREKLTELKKKKQRLIFGTTLTIGEFVIPDRLASFLNKYQNTSVHMVVSNTSDLLERINRGELDFAIIEGYFSKAEYDFITYSSENFIPVCGYDYKFKNSVFKISDLLGETLIVRETGSGTREILERIIGEKNLSLCDFKNMVEINNLNVIKSLVSSNCGITFLYEAAAREEIKSKKLKIIELYEYDVTHDFTFVWRKGSIFAERYMELYSMLKS